jgi:hypothetical protein
MRTSTSSPSWRRATLQGRRRPISGSASRARTSGMVPISRFFRARPSVDTLLLYLCILPGGSGKLALHPLKGLQKPKPMWGPEPYHPCAKAVILHHLRSLG